ncbi:phage tail tube protein [Nonomuraea sp. SYSU D8015]|uniref:phage tail tube protein n=1 Tax=Nonomuraea sp. SYSU D8015 TaxID=2593644 RepID=UPI001660DD01|nr:hypothetical protein [Nonomuraea sp. SYSU D8015]
MPRGNPANLALGPGTLYIAVLGTPEPADLTTPWASVSANWIQLGYTDEGSTFNYSVDSENVEVAEELDPVAVALTSRELSLSFSLAEMTAANLKRALNGGTITSGTGIVTFEPPDLGEEVRTMLGWESEDHTERWVYRKALQVGNMEVSRAKGAAKATIRCEFKLERPAAAKAFKAIMATARAA